MRFFCEVSKRFRNVGKGKTTTLKGMLVFPLLLLVLTACAPTKQNQIEHNSDVPSDQQVLIKESSEFIHGLLREGKHRVVATDFMENSPFGPYNTVPADQPRQIKTREGMIHIEKDGHIIYVKGLGNVSAIKNLEINLKSGTIATEKDYLKIEEEFEDDISNGYAWGWGNRPYDYTGITISKNKEDHHVMIEYACISKEKDKPIEEQFVNQVIKWR